MRSARYSRALLLTAVLLAVALPVRGQELPEGKGKELVAAQCNSCHPFFARLGGGYTPEGWRTVMRMMTNHGVAIPPDQLDTVTEYLSRNFPEKPKPAGVVLPGPAKVTIKSWTVPTPGSRPHDPLATRDGALWYTGQMNNVLGRLDPATGRSRSIRSRRRTAGPTASWKTKPATSGTRETPERWSEGSTPKRVRSPSTRCRTRTQKIRTR